MHVSERTMASAWLTSTAAVATVNLYTKHEVFMFAHYEDMTGNEKCKN